MSQTSKDVPARHHPVNHVHPVQKIILRQDYRINGRLIGPCGKGRDVQALSGAWQYLQRIACAIDLKRNAFR